MFNKDRKTLTLLVLLMIGSTVVAEKKLSAIPDPILTVLEKAEKFELLSISPERLKEKPADDFHGWKVLGKTEVNDADVRKKIVTELQKGVAESKGNVALCFNPRHAIRLTRNGKTTDLLICFECLQVQVFASGKQEDGFLIERSPQAVFDQVLKNAKVPLPPKP